MKKQEGWSVFSSEELRELYSAWEDGRDEVWHRAFLSHGIDPQDYDDAILHRDADFEDVCYHLSFVNGAGDEVLIENAVVEDELRDMADYDFITSVAEGMWRE